MRKLLTLIGLLCAFNMQAQEPATSNGVSAQQVQKMIATSEARTEAKIVKSLEKKFQAELDKSKTTLQKKINNLSYVNTKQAQKIDEQAATITALENQIKTMGGKVGQVEKSNNDQNATIATMETSVSDLEASTNDKVDTIYAKISSVTTIWMIAIIVVLILGIGLFVTLNKKVKSATETIDTKLKKTEDMIKEDGWNLFHDKLVKFMASRK